MRFLCVAASLLLFAYISTAQSFEMTDGTRSKSIKNTDLIEVKIGGLDGEDESYCSFLTIRGHLIDVRTDSVSFLMSHYWLQKSFELGEPFVGLDLRLQGAHLTVPKSDILTLTNFRSEKARRRRSVLTGIAGSLLVGGGVTMLSNLILDGGSDFYLAGGIQMGVGLILGMSSTATERQFGSPPGEWRFK